MVSVKCPEMRLLGHFFGSQTKKNPVALSCATGLAKWRSGYLCSFNVALCDGAYAGLHQIAVSLESSDLFIGCRS